MDRRPIPERSQSLSSLEGSPNFDQPKSLGDAKKYWENFGNPKPGEQSTSNLHSSSNREGTFSNSADGESAFSNSADEESAFSPFDDLIFSTSGASTYKFLDHLQPLVLMTLQVATIMITMTSLILAIISYRKVGQIQSNINSPTEILQTFPDGFESNTDGVFSSEFISSETATDTNVTTTVELEDFGATDTAATGETVESGNSTPPPILFEEATNRTYFFDEASGFYYFINSDTNEAEWYFGTQ
jgi:hypothetical protein